MPIVSVEPPERAAGRRSRLSEDELTTLAQNLKDAKPGEFFGDGQLTGTKSAAYQRAQAAVKAVKQLGSKAELRTTVWPADENDTSQGYFWAVGPRPAGERPRGRRPEAAKAAA